VCQVATVCKVEAEETLTGLQERGKSSGGGPSDVPSGRPLVAKRAASAIRPFSSELMIFFRNL